MTLIIPYTTEQLNWHLSNNVEPRLSKSTIEVIVTQCNLVNMGEMNLDEEIVTGANVTVAQMLDDLHIGYNI